MNQITLYRKGGRKPRLVKIVNGLIAHVSYPDDLISDVYIHCDKKGVMTSRFNDHNGDMAKELYCKWCKSLETHVPVNTEASMSWLFKSPKAAYCCIGCFLRNETNQLLFTPTTSSSVT